MTEQKKKTKRDIALLTMVNKEGKFLLQHRSENIERWPGYWGFFGGGIEDGETAEEGLKREIMEELGYVVDNHRLIIEQDFIGDSHFGKRYIYVCEYDVEQELVLCSESQDYGWYYMEELEGVRMHADDHKTIRKYKGKFL